MTVAMSGFAADDLEGAKAAMKWLAESGLVNATRYAG
jgi:hypothetical protein